jgi:hypothetical protein
MSAPRLPSLSPSLCPMHHPTPRTPHPRASHRPPLKGRCHPLPAGSPPAPCFSSRSNAAPAPTFPASAASRRTALRTPPPRRSRSPTGTPLRRPLPATPPSSDLLSELRLHSSCTVSPRDPTGACRQHLVAGQPPPRRRTHELRVVTTPVHAQRARSAREPLPRLGRAARSWPSWPRAW